MGPGVCVPWVPALWCVVRRNICLCCGLLGALGRRAWLVCRLNRLIMDEQIIVGMLVAQGVLPFLRVQLDAILQLCVRSFHGRERHVAHSGLCIGCIVSDDSVELQGYCPS